MMETRRKLLAAFYSAAALLAAVCIAGEADMLPSGWLPPGSGIEYTLLSAMELATVCTIPLSLRLFKFACVVRRLTSVGAYAGFSHLRLSAMAVPMLANAVFYYAGYNVAFGYMAIILALSCLFVYPTEERCSSEFKGWAS